MRRRAILGGIVGSGLLALTLWGQNPFREYPPWEPHNLVLPRDYNIPAEWTFARLMYPTTHYQFDWQSEYRRGFDWREGFTNWTIDYPRSDRHLAMAVRRLTRLDAKSVEQTINLERDDDVFNYPWMYAAETGHWELTPSQIAKFREFLLRGGFFMCDDFHGADEWQIFMETMQKVFPDRQVVDIDNKDAIFHLVFDLDDRYQVPGAQYLRSRSICEKCATSFPPAIGGDTAHWRGIYDDHGRVMVAICHNMDLGDSWEHADDPTYPERFSALGMRIGVNYVVYSMTH
jgi:hypothetical protein